MRSRSIKSGSLFRLSLISWTDFASLTDLCNAGASDCVSVVGPSVRAIVMVIKRKESMGVRVREWRVKRREESGDMVEGDVVVD